MKNLSFLSFIMWLLVVSNGHAQNEIIQLNNPSFEDDPHAGTMDNYGRRTIIKDWQDCGQFYFTEETPPDIHPNDFWDVNIGPSHGYSYIGMVVRKQESWESVSQRLNTPIKKNQCYQATLDLSRSDNYWSATKETVQGTNVFTLEESTARKVNFTKPAVLRIWGGSGFCNDKQLLWESSAIDHSDWRTYDVFFESSQNHNYITLEAYFKTPVLTPYNGHILLDNISDIVRVPCDDEPQIIASTPTTPPENEKVVPMHLRRKKNPPVVENKIAQPKKEEPASVKPKTEKIMKDLDRKVIKVGQTLEINNLYFQADKTDIVEDSHEVLDEVYSFMQENPDVIIEIGGHTNGTPEHSYCDELSEKRAKSVANYLISKGVPSERVLFKGYGKRRPIATNRTKEGRKKNQRVEIKIMSLDE